MCVEFGKRDCTMLCLQFEEESLHCMYLFPLLFAEIPLGNSSLYQKEGKGKGR